MTVVLYMPAALVELPPYMLEQAASRLTTATIHMNFIIMNS